MRALIQRVSSASVQVAGETVGAIDHGLLLFLGVEPGDSPVIVERMLDKVLGYRVFADAEGRMNANVVQAGGGVLAVSQFTLAADTRKGLRPGFSTAAPPAQAEALYDTFVAQLKRRHSPVATGVFGADMQIALVNDGPVTFLLDIH
ncbi:D-aminoacyl-tRNA deacylase [Marinimicrobium alkaliphilum]|uniref:D-aminoacyl-tRNA deacylase n=1 Tax=Marinimicrobium alkaliphilum TaxID=2202654 RepID=UPI000DB998B6|nr:D-aminoacyl-tRNA deacylase [Marinimicrobium alkaliphilum]